MTQVSRVLRSAPIWASFLLSNRHALAEDAPQQAAQAVPTANPDARSARPESPDPPAIVGSERAATVAYQKALASYSQGDVAGALDSMRQSYQLSKRAELLYNLAQLEEELKACSDALADYRRYLELVPQGRYREPAERAQARLELECPMPAATLSQEPASPAEPQLPTNTNELVTTSTQPTSTAYWTAPRVIGWSAIAGGTLAGAGALYFQLEAIQAKADYQKSVDDAYAGGPPPDESLKERQHKNNDLAIAFAITGGALLTGGAFLLLLDPGKHEPHSRSAGLYAVPGLVGACYGQSF